MCYWEENICKQRGQPWNFLSYNGFVVNTPKINYPDDNKDAKVRDTFRAFKNHKLTDPLKDVGFADLTADVDFGYLKQFTDGENTISYGPVSQLQFLNQLGITVRCNSLKDYNPKLSEELDQNLDMLINPEKMGERFKFFCMFPKTMQPIHASHPPAGFYENKSWINCL